MGRLSIAFAASLLAVACSKSADQQASANAMLDGNPVAAAFADNGARPQQGGRAPVQGRGTSANAVRVQKVDIIDPNGFEKPIPASFGFIPAGWKTQGGIQWGQQFACTNGYNVNWVATSPDGSQAIAVLPMARWEANNYGAPASAPGCSLASFTTARQYLEFLVKQIKPGAQVIDFRPRPDMAKQFAYANSTTPSAMGEFRSWVESGEVLFRYNEQGRDMRGVVSSTLFFSLTRTTGINPGQTMDALSASSNPAFAATAPNGQLNIGVIEAIRQSFIPNPSWQAAIARHNNAIAKVGIEEAGKRSRMITEANDYISALRAETQASRDASNARISRERGEVIRGTETYNDRDGPGGQVELSGYYDNAWKLNDGTYVLSNDVNFEPGRDLGLEGRKLEPTR